MPDPNLRDRVAHTLATRVAPALSLDGVGIEVVDVADGIASVCFTGACTSCPATFVAILSGLEQELKKHVPEVEILEAVP